MWLGGGIAETVMSKAILYDAALCICCKQCEQACAGKNKLPYNEAIAAAEKPPGHKFTAVLNCGGKLWAGRLTPVVPGRAAA